MPTVTKVDDLKINKLTKAQYDAAVQTGVIGENEISIITDLDESTQVNTMPTADASLEGKIYQFISTTDQNYTNGYFYKCVSDGAVTPTYSWERIDVQPAPVIPDPLPSQSGQSGKFLTTDGSSATWSNIPDPLPSQTGNAGKVLMTNGTTASWVDMTTTPQTTPVLQGTATYWITDPNTGVISQTINVQGVTPTNVVMVSPSALSAEDYAAAGIFCVDQGNGTLTFTCKTIPSVDITLTVICF